MIYMKLSIAMFLVFAGAGILNAQDKTAADMPKDTKTIKIIEMLRGAWKLQGIVDEERKPSTANDQKKQSNDSQQTQDVDNDQSRNAMQMLEFDPEARYKVNNSTTAIDSGSYRVNEQQGILYMESDADDITPTEWAVSVNKDKLTLTGRGAKADSRYKYIYIKEKEEVNKK
jgi:hypothetical protein